MGEKYYRALDHRSKGQKINTHTTEGKEMRAVIKQFDKIKRKFSNNVPDMKLDLPGPLANLNIPGRVKEGELKITKYVTCISFGWVPD